MGNISLPQKVTNHVGNSSVLPEESQHWFWFCLRWIMGWFYPQEQLPPLGRLHKSSSNTLHSKAKAVPMGQNLDEGKKSTAHIRPRVDLKNLLPLKCTDVADLSHANVID